MRGLRTPALGCAPAPRRTASRLAGYDARMSDDFCTHGCYWECDHRRRPYAGRPIAAIDSVRHAEQHLQRQLDAAGQR